MQFSMPELLSHRIIGVASIVAVIIIIYILIREFRLWYWKVDKIEKLLNQIEENTRKKNEQKSDFQKGISE